MDSIRHLSFPLGSGAKMLTACLVIATNYMVGVLQNENVSPIHHLSIGLRSGEFGGQSNTK